MDRRIPLVAIKTQRLCSSWASFLCATKSSERMVEASSCFFFPFRTCRTDEGMCLLSSLSSSSLLSLVDVSEEELESSLNKDVGLASAALAKSVISSTFVS